MHALDHYRRMAEAGLASLKLTGEPDELYEPVRYILSIGGKRLRPAMTLAACDLCQGNTDDAMGPALGIELFHNFTLLHDDIMDAAPIRRGKATVHTRWDANRAILSGDTMFALAGRLMLLTRPEAIGAILQLFFDTAVEVCEGQQMDMNFEQRDDVSSEGYLEMIRLKTAVLIASSLKIGALAAGAAGETAGLFYQFGLAAGMAFQLQDDLLDTFGDEGAFGKMSGGDIAANKKTYLYITAMQEANSAQKRRLQELYHSQPQDPSGKIKEVRELFLSLAVPARVSKKMKEYHSAAHEHLSMLTELTGPSAILSEFVDTVISRSQ